MGIFTGKPVYARHRNGQNCIVDPTQARPVARAAHIGLCASLIWLLIFSPAFGETVRLATYNVSLGRKGPGLLLRDLEKGTDKQIKAVQQIIATVRPDILLLNDFDFDLGLAALDVFADQLDALGLSYPFRFALPPNSGLSSGLDLDGDGRLGGPGDSQCFGDFFGSQGMAILSRYRFDESNVKDFSSVLWRDLPNAQMPVLNGRPFPSEHAQVVQRLSSKGHWDVPVILPDDKILHLLAAHATPPVFDGPEDQNGLRNRDEIRFWLRYLARIPKGEHFAVLGDLNADPNDGDAFKDSIRGLLAHPQVQDPTPLSLGGMRAAIRQAGPNAAHVSDPRFDTVDWDESRTQGNMRVDYVLPSAGLQISDAGVFWPAPDDPGFDLVGLSGDVGSHHRLVWVDIQ